MKYTNMKKGEGKLSFRIRRVLNGIRTFLKFHLKFPWVKYKGFVRVMKGVNFAKGTDIRIGDRVQFGPYTDVATDVHFGNDILIAAKVNFVGRHDHDYSVPGQCIWDGERGTDSLIVVEDDVWIGAAATILSGVTIGKGSIVGAGSVVTRSIPPYEIWAGNPARKISDRFTE